MLMSSGDASRFSGQDRSMQRPWLVQTGCGGGGGARALGFREEEDDGKGRVTKT